jgi:transcriptional regulator with XRE-family HTH domain
MKQADPKPTRRVLARRVRSLRRALGLTQEELAERVGLPQAQISELESARNNIRIDNLHRLAVALGVRPHELLDDQAFED